MFAALTGWCVATTSGTFDETTYLRFGRGLYESRDVEALTGWGVAPLPAWILAAPPIATAPSYRQSVARARAAMLALFGVPLVLLVYVSLARGAGIRAALAAAALVALSPNVIAHASLATTDVAFVTTALAALLALTVHLECRSTASAAWLVASLALALAVKYSGLVLFPIVAVACAFSPIGGRSFLRCAVEGLALAGAAFVVALTVVWGLHGFALAPYGLPPFESVRMPASIVGIARQLHHQTLGEPAFLLGRRSQFGWWYYMPVALAMKSTPAELLLAAAAMIVVLARPLEIAPSGIVWRVAFVAFAASGLLNRLALGIRYELVLIPLVTLISLERWRTNAVWMLVALQAVSAFVIAPHDLSYFNALAGGPARGYTKLADSNVDWGQDLPALREALADVGAAHPLVSYFGTAPLDAYGVHAEPWNAGLAGPFDRWDWIAISATNIDGVFLRGDPFERFRRLPPDARAGYSILLFDVRRSEVREAMAYAATR